MTEVPEWLRLLVQARTRMGFPPAVEMAELSGLSTKTVYRVFGGRSQPNYHTLYRLANALTTDEESAARIVAALGKAKQTMAAVEVEDLPAVTDAEVIASALREAGAMIAKAIQDSHDVPDSAQAPGGV